VPRKGSKVELVHHPRYRPIWQRIADKVFLDPWEGHHLWRGAVDRDGRPVLAINRQFTSNRPVHRLVYEQEFGELGADELVNTCGEKRCVNPKHHTVKFVIPEDPLDDDRVQRLLRDVQADADTDPESFGLR
jgi:hypothetical protein